MNESASGGIPSTEESSCDCSRRELLRSLGRIVALGGLAAMVGYLRAPGRIRRSAGPHAADCALNVNCSGCRLVAACRLPRRFRQDPG